MDRLAELIEKVRHGDQAAYAEVVELCDVRVRVVAASILHNREAVADVAQDAFVMAYGKLGEYKDGTNFYAWISAITRNLAMNQRTQYMRKFAIEKDYETQVDVLIQSAVECITDGMSQDVFPALHDCVAEMGLPARDVVRKFYFDKASTREISLAHSRPESWARVVLHRARVLLRDCLGKKGVLTGEY